MEKFIILNKQRINYLVEIKPRNKHIRLVVKAGNIIVRHNGRIRQADIDKLFYDNANWIIDNLNKSRDKQAKPESNQLFYLGKPYQLHYHQSSANEIKLITDECHIYVADIEAEREIIKQHFYINQCNQLLPELVKKWENTMQLFATRVRIRQLKSKWGSCNHANSLVFNCMLMQLPVFAIEYIIIHELAHIKHKNHSAQFWQCVADYAPNYKEINKLIRQYEKEF